MQKVFSLLRTNHKLTRSATRMDCGLNSLIFIHGKKQIRKKGSALYLSINHLRGVLCAIRLRLQSRIFLEIAAPDLNQFLAHPL